MDYSDKVMEHFRNPRNTGKIEEGKDTAVGEVGNPSCGDVMKLYLKINDNTITEAKFQTYGCPVSIACSSITTELILGKTLEEAEKITKVEIANALDGIPPQKMSCSNLGSEAIHSAIKNYRNKTAKKSSKKSRISKVMENISENEIRIDLRGKQCPMTFVYTKVALEEMKKNQILEVILDFKNAFTNVPKSVRQQNLGEIIKEREENGIKTIWIKKT